MKCTINHILAATLPMIGVTACAAAQLAPSDADVPAATVRLLTQTTSIAPGSKTWIGIEFHIAPKWHIYWPGQNDAGYAPVITWDLPDGITVGDIQWPTPHRHILPGDILDHIYEDQAVLVAVLSASPHLPSDSPVTLNAHVEWLECEEGCVPRDAHVSATLPVASNPPARAADAPILEASLARIPTPAGDQVRIEWKGDSVTLSPQGVRASRLAFYPGETAARIDDPLRNAETKAASISLPLKPGSDQRAPLAGILQAWDASGASIGAWMINAPRPGIAPAESK